ncbi:MAG: class I SAM-dependent methyltransferase, partial [Actinomycetota bacterium]
MTGDIVHVDETTCRACGTTGMIEVLAFGQTPLADRLLTEEQLDGPEPSAPLTLEMCPNCGLIQIRETVDPEVLFFSEYPYFSSVSPSLMRHFQASAEALIERRGLGPDSLVIEAASNDGYMLRHFKAAGVPVLGIDPAEAPAQSAIDEGIDTMIDFFGLELAERLVAEGKRADVFCANNVLAHVPDLNGFVAGIATLLTDDGVAVIEAPYVVDLVDHVEFDTIYHQHLCYFSITALIPLFEQHGLHLNDVERTAIHGGSLRLFIERTDERSERVQELLDMEVERGVDGVGFFSAFAERCNLIATEMREILDAAKAEGRRVVGYGAAAKACTMIAWCGITRDDLDYVIDANPYKHGPHMGGAHLPSAVPAPRPPDPPPAGGLHAW